MSQQTDSYRLDPRVAARARTPLLIIAVIGWVLCIIGFAVPGLREQFHFSYHMSFIYFTTITLGALFFVMVQRLTTAGWSVVVRRIAEVIAANFWLIAILFIPIAIGVIYPPHGHSGAIEYFEWNRLWHDPGSVANDQVLQHKKGYFELSFFFARAVFYLLIWSVVSWQLYRHSTAQDDDGNPEHARYSFRWAAAGFPLFFIFGTLAIFDWIMSLAPHWFSTAFGLYNLAGGGLGFMGVLILICAWLRSNNTLRHSITIEHYHDMGKLLFTFMIFWAYVGFSQYMLIWYANQSEETFYFHDRLRGSWSAVTWLLAVGHFILPFILLLSRDIKRNVFTLSLAAGWMLLMHLVDVYWMVMPALHKSGVGLHWLDLAALMAVGGTLGVAFIRLLGKHSLVPVRDPFLTESLAFENA
ncbi:MAG TPA: quinol:cytochrome C oxidoreductase [Blastocatellia bacterium]|nr:quinol:cytochrome C oxidoreductase [Blastocatellia bacterium]